jgi:hypothetical protein
VGLGVTVGTAWTGVNMLDCAVVAANADRIKSNVTMYLARRRINSSTSLKLNGEAIFDNI